MSIFIKCQYSLDIHSHPIITQNSAYIFTSTASMNVQFYILVYTCPYIQCPYMLAVY